MTESSVALELWHLFVAGLGVAGGVSLLYARLKGEQRARAGERAARDAEIKQEMLRRGEIEKRLLLLENHKAPTHDPAVDEVRAKMLETLERLAHSVETLAARSTAEHHELLKQSENDHRDMMKLFSKQNEVLVRVVEKLDAHVHETRR